LILLRKVVVTEKGLLGSAQAAKDHSTYLLAQAADFIGIGSAPEAFGEVEELSLFALLCLFGYGDTLPGVHNPWYMYYKMYKRNAG
jgi:hypothetical protein